MGRAQDVVVRAVRASVGLVLVACIGGTSCKSDSSEPSTFVPQPCPAPWSSAPQLATSDSLSSLQPRNVDACVHGFLGSTTVARFDAGARTLPAWPGEAVPRATVDAMLEAFERELPRHVGGQSWTLVQSAQHATDEGQDIRILLRGDSDTMLFILEHAG